MSRRDDQRLEDILAAVAAISGHLDRGDLDDGLVFDAVRVRLIEIGEAALGTTDVSELTDIELLALAADISERESMRTWRSDDLEVEFKPDGSPVSVTDKLIERLLRELLARHRPDDRILGEEQGDTGSGSRCWVLDPIDGTSSVVAGRRAWGSLIALEVDGRRAAAWCRCQPSDVGGGARSTKARSSPTSLARCLARSASAPSRTQSGCAGRATRSSRNSTARNENESPAWKVSGATCR